MVDQAEIAAPDALGDDVEGVEIGELALRPGAKACEPESLEYDDRRERSQHEADIDRPLRGRGLKLFQGFGEHKTATSNLDRSAGRQPGPPSWPRLPP